MDGPGQPVQFGHDHHPDCSGPDQFEHTGHGKPVEVTTALTGVNQNAQKFDVMGRRHGSNRVHLGVQTDATIRLPYCRDSHVTNARMFSKPFQHTKYAKLKLSEYFIRHYPAPKLKASAIPVRSR